MRAYNARELLEGIRKVPASSIYYHTHRFLQQHHYLSPEPPNDFAYWFTHILVQRELGEALASVNTVGFRSMEELRSEFIRILEGAQGRKKSDSSCPEGHEFHFMSCVTFIFPTLHVARDLREFDAAIEKVSVNSLYFHMFEARMRLQRDENDFSAWLKGIGQPKLAAELVKMDPYTMTLDSLRQKIRKAVKKYGQH